MLTTAESYFVDAFNPRTSAVYEFHGCYYHGCVKCFKNSRHQRRNCHSDRTVEEVYQATALKTQSLRQAGYRVIEKWECDFEQDKKTDPALQAFLKEFELVEPMDPRDGFFGGRTGAVCLQRKPQNLEKR